MAFKSDTLDKDTLHTIKLESNFLSDKETPLKEDVFKLLEKKGSLIFYPLDEAELWGVYLYKQERHYFLINSSIEMEKQVFVAAHELAHSLPMAKVVIEYVTAELMTEYIDHEKHGDSLMEVELIANRFAAELLVSKENLKREYESIPDHYPEQVKAVLLSDFFLVPYKTIVKRLAETEILPDEMTINSLLEVDNESISMISDRFECRNRNREISNRTHLGGFANKAISLYENELSTYDELKDRLTFIDKTPEDFQIGNSNIKDLLLGIMNNPDFGEADEED